MLGNSKLLGRLCAPCLLIGIPGFVGFLAVRRAQGVPVGLAVDELETHLKRLVGLKEAYDEAEIGD